jgi:hypothetical protein
MVIACDWAAGGRRGEGFVTRGLRDCEVQVAKGEDGWRSRYQKDADLLVAWEIASQKPLH